MGPFALEEFSTFVVVVVLAVMIAWLLFRSHRYLSRQDKGWSPAARRARPKPCQPGPQLDAPDEAIRWELSMHETARDLAGQLDSKMSALGHLIQEADRAAARLEQALGVAPRGADQSEPGKAQEAERPSSEPPDELDPLPPGPSSQADALKGAGPWDRLSPGNSDAHGRPRSPADDRYEEIYMLADYGFDAAEIARRVASPVGEVQLILSLRSKR